MDLAKRPQPLKVLVVTKNRAVQRRLSQFLGMVQYHVLQAADAHWHDYGKQARPGRKVGHATLCAPDAGQLAARLGGIASVLGREAQVAPVLQALGHL